MQVFQENRKRLCPPRNEASLNFVSLRSHVDSEGRRGPSRIKMNALRAPLTVLYVTDRRKVAFSLDSADAFIEAGDTTGMRQSRFRPTFVLHALPLSQSRFSAVGYVFALDPLNSLRCSSPSTTSLDRMKTLVPTKPVTFTQRTDHFRWHLDCPDCHL